MATIAVRACLNYKYESRVMQPTDWRRHFVVRPRPSREPSVVVLPPVLTLGVTPIMDRTGGVMKAPRSARPVGADHSLQRAARFRFPKTGIVPAVLILCGGIWWWLSRTPDSVCRRTPGMREPSYRRACNPPAIWHTGPKRPCRRLFQWGEISSFDRCKRATSVGRSERTVVRALPSRWLG